MSAGGEADASAHFGPVLDGRKRAARVESVELLRFALPPREQTQ